MSDQNERIPDPPVVLCNVQHADAEHPSNYPATRLRPLTTVDVAMIHDAEASGLNFDGDMLMGCIFYYIRYLMYHVGHAGTVSWSEGQGYQCTSVEVPVHGTC